MKCLSGWLSCVSLTPYFVDSYEQHVCFSECISCCYVCLSLCLEWCMFICLVIFLTICLSLFIIGLTSILWIFAVMRVRLSGHLFCHLSLCLIGLMSSWWIYAMMCVSSYLSVCLSSLRLVDPYEQYTWICVMSHHCQADWLSILSSQSHNTSCCKVQDNRWVGGVQQYLCLSRSVLLLVLVRIFNICGGKLRLDFYRIQKQKKTQAHTCTHPETNSRAHTHTHTHTHTHRLFSTHTHHHHYYHTHSHMCLHTCTCTGLTVICVDLCKKNVDQECLGSIKKKKKIMVCMCCGNKGRLYPTWPVLSH